MVRLGLRVALIEKSTFNKFKKNYFPLQSGLQVGNLAGNLGHF